MKIKSIAAICKKNKNIAIFERYSDDGDILTQYIGDGSAVYPVVGLPQLDKESLLTIFDVPEKDRDNYFVKTLGVPAGISRGHLNVDPDTGEVVEESEVADE